jgi:hypothetical protein
MIYLYICIEKTIYIYYQIGDQHRGPPTFTIFRICDSTPRRKILLGRLIFMIGHVSCCHWLCLRIPISDSITVLCLRIPTAWLSCFALTATCKVGLAPCLVLSCPVLSLAFVLSNLYLCRVSSLSVSCLLRLLSCLAAFPCLALSYLVLSHLTLSCLSRLICICPLQEMLTCTSRGHGCKPY